MGKACPVHTSAAFSRQILSAHSFQVFSLQQIFPSERISSDRQLWSPACLIVFRPRLSCEYHATHPGICKRAGCHALSAGESLAGRSSVCRFASKCRPGFQDDRGGVVWRGKFNCEPDSVAGKWTHYREENSEWLSSGQARHAQKRRSPWAELRDATGRTDCPTAHRSPSQHSPTSTRGCAATRTKCRHTSTDGHRRPVAESGNTQRPDEDCE